MKNKIGLIIMFYFKCNVVEYIYLKKSKIIIIIIYREIFKIIFLR